MKLLLLTIIITITCLTCTSPPLLDTKENRIEKLLVDSSWNKKIRKEKIHKGKDIELKSNRNTMINDIIQVWEMFLDDANCKQNDPRRANFPRFAEELTDAIIMYQNEPTDIGGQLPENRAVHILMAVIVTKESSIIHNAVGAAPRFEVGLMQIHGVALAGYDPNLVKNNSRLGLLLGVRWFAAQMDECKIHRIPKDTKKWRIDDLVGPLSVYAGGSKAIKKNGKCYKYIVARQRINLTKLYLTRINSTNNA